jgi:phage FluMu protein Com
MIDSNGNLRCDNCGKKLGENLEGRIEIVCPRCHYYNVFTDVKRSNLQQPLDRNIKAVLISD